jgi:Peptidase family M1 domain
MPRARFWLAGVAALIAVHPLVSPSFAEPIHHKLSMKLQPENNYLEAEDTVTLPVSYLSASGGSLEFLLRNGLEPTTTTPGVKISRGANGNSPAPSRDTKTYRILIPAGRRDIDLHYRGKIRPKGTTGSFDDPADFDAGSISSRGIFLAGSTYWYPWFNDDPVVFSLEVRMPEPWQSVSEGERVRHDRKGGMIRDRWESSDPQLEIFLIGGRFTEYDRTAGSVRMMVFLRTPDPDLANRYLETGARYLDMYRNLIGPYPYKKFAVVENFWETGYGMPSMTLLGPAVLRLPFILQSSYPHEILHNWWGNGVFVDDQTGNWSEGLTTYMADYLLQEQLGSASEYRRSALQKYADYVARQKDFPLSDFHARYNPASEAIGYGKAMMFFHMLRRQLGDASFLSALRSFYTEHRFRRAGYDDLRAAFSVPAGNDLKGDFHQWVDRTGAPSLKISRAGTRARQDGIHLLALLEQTQPGPVYRLQVPIAITLEGQATAFQTVVEMNTRRMNLEIPVPGLPVRLDIDPEFDLFRQVDRGELPPAISQALGAEASVILLPSKADDAVRQGYRAFAERWARSRPGSIEIKRDDDVPDLPTDRAIWILGWENRFFPAIIKTLAGRDIENEQNGLRIETTPAGRRNRTIVLASRQPRHPDAALIWLSADPLTALPGLARKLPHYGPFSYLVFEGQEPKNVLKGRWDVTDSPLSIPVAQPDGRLIQAPRGRLQIRRRLADLPP